MSGIAPDGVFYNLQAQLLNQTFKIDATDSMPENAARKPVVHLTGVCSVQHQEGAWVTSQGIAGPAG